MLRRFIVPFLLAPTLVALATSCGSDGADDATFASVAPATASPSPAATTATTSSVVSPTTVDKVPTTSVAPETSTTAAPTTLVADTVVGLSADGPWKLVDGAPGVDSPGLVYELMPKLWVFLPTEESDDDGTLFVPSPDDIPVIEAYLRARLVYFQAITSDPIDLEHPGWATEYLDGGASYRNVLEPRRSRGEVADLDVGVVLRPRVLGEGRTEFEAIVFDCVLDGGVFRLPSGELAEGSTPGVVRSGRAAQVVASDGGWTIERVSNQEIACG